MSELMTKCPRCAGCGKVPIPPHLMEVLRALKRPMDAQELQAVVNPSITPNAFSNRLLDLMGLGLVCRTRIGKNWKYVKAVRLSALKGKVVGK